MTLSRNSFREMRSGGRRFSGRAQMSILLVTLLLTGGALLARQHAAADPGTPAGKRGADAVKLTAPMAADWKFTSAYFPNNPVTPVLGEGVAYFAAGNRVYAVSLATGTLKWRYPTDTTLTTYVGSAPVLSNGALYFGTGDGLYALNAENGRPMGSKAQIYSLKAGVYTAPIVVGDSVYFGTSNGKIYAIDGKTGEALPAWKGGIESGGDLASDLVVAGDYLYYVTGDQGLHAVNLKSGTPRWAMRMDSSARNPLPVIVGESMYLATGATLSSWRTGNGQRRWSVPLPSDVAAPPAVDADGTSYIITSDREIYAVDTRGRGVWRQPAKVDYEVIAQPVVADNLLIVGTTLGGVYAFDTANGALKWSYRIQPSSANPNSLPASTNIAARPVVSGDTLYVFSDDGTLTSFRHSAPDALPPTVTKLEPEQGDYLNGRPPFRISAKIADEGSGLNLDTLSLKLDDRMIPRRPNGRDYSDKPGFTFNPDDGALEYNILESDSGPSTSLADGHHKATIIAKDWMGNTITKTWTFFVDDTLPRRARKTNNNTTPGRNSGRGGGKLGGGGGGGGRGGGGNSGGGEGGG